MKVQTKSLQGRALDWAVAKVLGNSRAAATIIDRPESYDFRPSSDWGIGGKIAHDHKISIHYCTDLRDLNGKYVHASTEQHMHTGYWRGDHLQPLTAVMRCLLQIKSGEFIEVPDDDASELAVEAAENVNG